MENINFFYVPFGLSPVNNAYSLVNPYSAHANGRKMRGRRSTVICVYTKPVEWQNATTHAKRHFKGEKWKAAEGVRCFSGKTLQARPCRSPISNLCTDSSTGRVLVKLWLPAFYSLLQLQQLKVLACGMQSWWATGAGVGGQGSGEALERKLTEKLKRQQIRCCNSQPERLMTAAN